MAYIEVRDLKFEEKEVIEEVIDLKTLQKKKELAKYLYIEVIGKNTKKTIAIEITGLENFLDFIKEAIRKIIFEVEKGVVYEEFDIKVELTNTVVMSIPIAVMHYEYHKYSYFIGGGPAIPPEHRHHEYKEHYHIIVKLKEEYPIVKYYEHYLDRNPVEIKHPILKEIEDFVRGEIKTKIAKEEEYHKGGNNVLKGSVCVDWSEDYEYKRYDLALTYDVAKEIYNKLREKYNIAEMIVKYTEGEAITGKNYYHKEYLLYKFP